MIEITVGSECTEGAYRGGAGGTTYLNRNSPCMYDGTINKVCLYVAQIVYGNKIKFKIFEHITDLNYKLISETIFFTVVEGYNEFNVNLHIKAGNYIGYFCPDGNFPRLSVHSLGSGRLYWPADAQEIVAFMVENENQAIAIGGSGESGVCPNPVASFTHSGESCI